MRENDFCWSIQLGSCFGTKGIWFFIAVEFHSLLKIYIIIELKGKIVRRWYFHIEMGILSKQKY